MNGMWELGDFNAFSTLWLHVPLTDFVTSQHLLVTQLTDFVTSQHLLVT